MKNERPTTSQVWETVRSAGRGKEDSKGEDSKWKEGRGWKGKNEGMKNEGMKKLPFGINIQNIRIIL